MDLGLKVLGQWQWQDWSTSGLGEEVTLEQDVMYF